MTLNNPHRFPSRRSAHPFDRPLDTDDASTHPIGVDTDAIGGARGRGWYEHFQCHRSGEIFSVHCSDGVESHDCCMAHSWDDDEWIGQMHAQISARVTADVERAHIAHISPHEWAILLKRERPNWTMTDRTRNTGRVGLIGTNPIVVMPNKTDDLGLPPSEFALALQLDMRHIDEAEDLAEQYEHLIP